MHIYIILYLFFLIMRIYTNLKNKYFQPRRLNQLLVIELVMFGVENAIFLFIIYVMYSKLILKIKR